jgi:serine/threonine protein kinase
MEAADTRCLGDDTILAFAQGLIDEGKAARIGTHLDGCDDCRALVAEAGRAIYDDASGLKTALERTASADPVQPGATIDRYHIIDQIGQGGMGIVYAAFDPQLRRKVAVKLLRADSADVDTSGEVRLLREAQAMAQLSHPNVVQVYDLGVAGNQVFVAMEYVEGTTLTAWLKSEARTVDQILDAFAWAGLGLWAAHNVGLVHRDFKPSNVLLSADGRVKVTDFGLARASADQAPAPLPQGTLRTPRSGERMFATVTETGAMIGTPAYMAPEQFGGAACDERADQFAFCATLFEALYKVHPFTDGLGTPMPSLLGSLTPRPPGSPVPPAVHAVLERGLASQRDARFASMDHLLRALEEARVARPGGMRVRTILAIAAACAVLLAGAFAIRSARHGNGRRTAGPVQATAAPAASSGAVIDETPEQPPPERVSAPPPERVSAPPPERVSAPPPERVSAPPPATEEPAPATEEPAPAEEPASPAARAPAKKRSSASKPRAASSKRTTTARPTAPARPRPAKDHPADPKDNPDGIIRDLWTSPGP